MAKRKTRKKSVKSVRKKSVRKKSVRKKSVRKKSAKGGNKYILNKLKYFAHVTSVTHLDSIFKEGALLTQNDIIQKKIKLDKTQGTVDGDGKPVLGEQFNGVYMSPVFDIQIKKMDPLELGDMVCLIFDKMLIKRKDYHMNEDDSFGKISSSQTWSNKYRNIGIERIYKSIKNNYLPEIIFHHNVSLSYLRAIIVDDDKTRQKVKKILKILKNTIPVIKSDKYQDIDYKSENITEEDKLLKPKFCSPFFDIDVLDADKEEEILSKIYENCNIKDDDMKTKFLNRDIQDNHVMFKTTAKNHPPYIFHNEDYETLNKKRKNKTKEIEEKEEEKRKKDKKRRKEGLKNLKNKIDLITENNLPAASDDDIFNIVPGGDVYILNKLLKINTKDSLDLFDTVYNDNFKIYEDMFGSKKKVIDIYIKDKVINN